MIDKILILIICIVTITIVIRETIFYKKNTYYPYPFRKKDITKKNQLLKFIIIFLSVFLFGFISTHQLKFYTFLCSITVFGVTEVILNLLSYTKIKDYKILLQTLLLSIIIILGSVFFYYI